MNDREGAWFERLAFIALLFMAFRGGWWTGYRYCIRTVIEMQQRELIKIMPKAQTFMDSRVQPRRPLPKGWIDEDVSRNLEDH